MLPKGTVVCAGDELELYNSIVRVDHVTPTGQIVLTDGRRFDNQGQPTGGRKWPSFKYELPPLNGTLELVTDEMRVKLLGRETYINFFKNVNWEKFDDATLGRVWAILKNATRQNETD